MVTLEKKGVLCHLFREPVYLYRWRLGWLFGHRCLLLTHVGRRSGLRRQTVLESRGVSRGGPRNLVANGFGPTSDWVLKQLPLIALRSRSSATLMALPAGEARELL